MGPLDVTSLVLQLFMGVSLAAACGLRAFLPLFLAALAARLGYLELSHGFAWLGTAPAVVCFGTAVFVELVGDKFPAVDHLLDVFGVAMKPAAATLLAASLVTHFDPQVALVLGLVAGAPVAAGVHLTRAKLRLGSSLLTLGFANPFISVIEDVVAFGQTMLALMIPAFAVLFAMGLGLVAWAVVRKRRRVAAV